MNGFIYKIIAVTFALIFTTILSSNLFATSLSSGSSKIYGAELGCMACHQMAGLQADQPLKKQTAKQRFQKTRVVPVE